MYRLTVTFLSLVSVVLVQAGSLDYCYGDVSICSEASDLYTSCEQYLGQIPDTQYWQCLCGNGYVATNEACHWCAVVFDDLPDYYDGPLETSACSSISATIAPIPSSIVAAISSLNATYTGSIPGASGGGGGGGGSGGGTGQTTATATSTTAMSVTQKASATKSTSPSSSEVSSGFFGLSAGSSTVVTIGGGGSPETTAAPLATQSGASQSSSTSTPEAGSKSVGTQTWNTGVASMLSAIIFTLTVLCMM